MENASKALIIAGSILIAIMIVALGVTIYNNATNIQPSFEPEEITMFNSKFERYDREQSGAQVKSLLSYAISNASSNKDELTKLPKIGNVEGQEKASNDIQAYINGISEIRKTIITTAVYEVEMHYASTGLIDEITITKK